MAPIEKYKEIERVSVPWARIYKYIDSENVLWLQKDFGVLCFGSPIFLSEKHSTVNIHWILVTFFLIEFLLAWW